jgi:peroxiredoxin
MWKLAPLLLIAVLPLYGETLDQAPRFEAENLDGETVSLDSLLQKGPVFVTFWALWCKPCIRELDDLKPVWEEYHTRGFEIVAISQDGPRSVSRVKPMVRSKGWDFTVLLDPDKELSRAFQVIALPTSFLIDTAGKVVRTQQGYKPGMEETIEKAIVDLLPDIEEEEGGEEEGEAQATQGDVEEERMEDSPSDSEKEKGNATEATTEDDGDEAPDAPPQKSCGGIQSEEVQDKSE